ncbi:MAG: CHAT domain-containing tetratricopeptide repeat protein [Pirellulales bacterium]
MNNLGLVLFDLKDDATARQAFLRASEIGEHAAAQKHMRYATFLNNLASVAARQHERAAAESYFQRAVEVARDAGGLEHPEYARYLSNLGSFYDAQNRPELAEPALTEALLVIRRNLDLATGGQSERQQLLMLRSLRFRLDNYLAFSARPRVAPEKAYDQVLAWKGAVFARQRRLRLARDQKELAPLFEQLQTVTGRLATMICALPAPEQRASWRAQSAALFQRKEELESELATRCAAFQKERLASRLTSAELRAALPLDMALVDLLEYSRSGLTAEGEDASAPQRQLTAFVVRRELPIVRIELGPAAPIEKAVEQWRRTFGEDEEGRHAASELHTLVWQPLQERLTGVKALLISPDGALARFPFAALPIDEAGHCLIERLPLAVVPVPQMLPELRAFPAKSPSAEARTTDPADTLLLLGDVDFAADPGRSNSDQVFREPPADSSNRTGARRFAPLPGFAREFQLIRDTFHNSHPGGHIHELRQTAATEEAFRRLATGSGYLHLVTHGFFAPAELQSILHRVRWTERGLAMLTTAGPNSMADGTTHGDLHSGLLSGIALAGANRDEAQEGGINDDDGILRAIEVAQMDLGAAELVVLSACETALGEAVAGEGLLGLQRAFQVAGARTVVASLWKVDDSATELLMERFYLNLWEKRLGKLDALRETQLWMLNGADGLLADRLAEGSSDAIPPRRLSARYWAAFVLSGDWR